MAWTAPRTWATSEVDTAAIFNAHLRDNMKALIAECRVFANTSAGGVPASYTAVLNWDGVTSDPLGMWSAGSPTRITVPIAGWYTYTGRLGGSSPTAFTVKLYKNGVLNNTGAASTSSVQVGEYDVQCAAGDYLELFVTTGSSAFTVGAYPGLGFALAT